MWITGIKPGDMNIVRTGIEPGDIVGRTSNGRGVRIRMIVAIPPITSTSEGPW
jgi:hypothetical protein